MRGKSKFIVKLAIIVLTVLSIGVVGAMFSSPQKIKKVNANIYNHEYCSQKYDDGIVFSVEQVYYNYSDRELELESGTETLPSILGYSDFISEGANNYFLNYGGTDKYSSKKIIYNGEYAMLDETVTRTVQDTDAIPNNVALNQGIMITLGGYIFDEMGNLHTNSEQSGVDGAGNPIYYSSNIQSMSISINGKDVSDGALRSYGDGKYFDFVYFIGANAKNEGHYKIEFNYTIDGKLRQFREFEFYILLKSEYSGTEKVNGQEYSKNPAFVGVSTIDTTHYSANVFTENEYPVLTYDYKHYDLKWAYTVNDLTTNVVVEYKVNLNDGIEQLQVTSETNNKKTINYYSCKEFTSGDSANNVVSFMFANVGKYIFNFSYVYYNTDGARLDVTNLSLDPIELNIYGYEMKYAKVGFNSADLRKVQIVQNGTLVIPVNGYIEGTVKADAELDLQYIYEFVAPQTIEGGKKKSGQILSVETADVTNLYDDIDGIAFDNSTKQFTVLGDKIAWVETDQGGLWFRLNDYFDLTNCYYVYSPTKFTKTAVYDSSENFKNIVKSTTFVKTGYYFGKVGYKETSDAATVYYQYFAFRITSGVVDVTLKATDSEEPVGGETLYSNQYTNKNVYATWADPSTFSSKQIATLYCAAPGAISVYETKANLIKFANGVSNTGLTSKEFRKTNTTLNTGSLITQSGSYLLEITIQGSNAKSYYYWTIDKDPISGIELLAVDETEIGSGYIYRVKRDKENKPVVYTDKVAIDKEFTIWWNDKKSGACITGTYSYTPLIYDGNINIDDIEKTDTEKHLWKVNNYKIGSTSSSIYIEKPATKISAVEASNVLTKQGIYWFYFEDDAGNSMNYMVVLDQTELKFDVKTKESNNAVNSGDIVAEDVILDYGTHKAIRLVDDMGAISGGVVEKLKDLINGALINYYGFNNNTSNYKSLGEYFKTHNVNIGGGQKTSLYYLAENHFSNVKIKTGLSVAEQIEIKKGTSNSGSKNILINDGKYHNLTFMVNATTEYIYTIEVYGANQISQANSINKFIVTLNADKSEGQVKSQTIGDAGFRTVIDLNTSQTITSENYYMGQASNDSLFVFEWVSNEGSEDFEVAKVSYTYYPMLSQTDLNAYDSTNERFKFYPYDFTNKKEEIIYDEHTKKYDIVKDSGLAKTIYRSTALNVDYLSWYNESGNLVSGNATKPGLYIIKREYKNDVGAAVKDSKIRYYVFSVDRNRIIDYAVGESIEKITGEYIDLLSQEIVFNNFTIASDKYEFNGKAYDIYLTSNRLPLEIRVPAGKYVSVNGAKDIIKTSNNASMGLKLTIKFIDKYNYLNSKEVQTEDLFVLNEVQIVDGYIVYKLDAESLNFGGNSGFILDYLAACKQVGNNWLSLPGVYVITISDCVGKDFEDDVLKTNTKVIGFEIIQNHPDVNLYAGSAADSTNNAVEAGFNVEENKTLFTTNKAYIRYELPKISNTSFNAQIDSNYILIKRTNKEGVSELYYDALTKTGKALETPGFDYKGKYYRLIGEDFVDGIRTIWLDSGLDIVDGKIVNYQEYIYTIEVRYVLGDKNEYKNSYCYNILEDSTVVESKQYYTSEFTVKIDRTGHVGNLENISLDQVSYLEEYLNNYNVDEALVIGKLDSKIYNTMAYRGLDGEDYFAVANSLYYYYVSLGDFESAENVMYAFKVNENEIVKTEDAGAVQIYYRKLYEGSDSKDRRMALLPICNQNVNGFLKFSALSYTGFNKFSTVSKNPTWNKVLSLTTNGYGYYEVIEIDASGNYTQYIVYLEETASNLSFTFKGAGFNNEVTFNFSDLIVTENAKTLDVITLVPFNGIIDIFNIEYNREDSGIKLNNGRLDWQYKIELVGSIESYAYYMNYNNRNLAQFIYNNLIKHADHNWSLSITDIYNRKLSLTINIFSGNYKLNTDDFNAIKDENEKWYLNPGKLNFSIGETGGYYYVKTIKIKDLTNNSKEDEINCVYDTNSWKINSLSDPNISDMQIIDNLIYLPADREYQIELIDCANNRYNLIKIYTYENAEDYKIDGYGQYSVVNNVYYSANPIEITYNKNIYNNVEINLYKNGEFEGVYNIKTFAETSLIELIEVKDLGGNLTKNNIIKLNPLNEVLKINEVGAKLEFRVYLLFNGQVDKVYNVVIDNRQPLILLTDNTGNNKNNIINVQYFYSHDNKNVTISGAELFKIAPLLTVSQTVILNWQNFDVDIYKALNTKYYYAYLYLLEYESQHDYNIIDLTNLTDTAMNISPKDGKLGRYVLVSALYNSEIVVKEGFNIDLPTEGLISYKTYSFDVSATTNAMFEVQSVNTGKTIISNALISGRELLDAMNQQQKVEDDADNTKFKVFGFIYSEPTKVEQPTDIGAADYAEKLKEYNTYVSNLRKYNNYIKLTKQTIQLYITNEDFRVVPNENNDIKVVSSELIINVNYKLCVYKIHNNVHETFIAILKVAEVEEMLDVNNATPQVRYVPKGITTPENLTQITTLTITSLGKLFFANYFNGGVVDGDDKILQLVKKNNLYLDVYYKYSEDNIEYVGQFLGELDESSGNNYVEFKTAGTYLIYLKDLAGNSRVWQNELKKADYLTLNILNEVLVTVNNNVPIDYNYYNDEVDVKVLYANAGYYDNGSIRMNAYRNGSSVDYISASGSKNTITHFVFTEYGSYKVVVEAKVGGELITKTLVFNIINPDEARIALDFTQISLHNITKVINTTTGIDVTDTFEFLLNEGYIYSKLITFDRLSAENAFGSVMGKQSFEVFYTVQPDPLVPAVEQSFIWTVNNQTPSLHSSIAPGESTTKKITVKFNPLTIYRQVGACYIVVNDTVMMPILDEATASDGAATLTLSEVGDYYVKIVTDSGRVLSTFKVTVKEPLNSWSIFAIVIAVIVVAGVIITFIVLRTKMKVR